MNLEACDICPRRCGVNRIAGEVGYCGAGKGVRVALVSLHQWEEPCLTTVGNTGSRTMMSGASAPATGDAVNTASCMGGVSAAACDGGNTTSCTSGISAAAPSGKICSLPTRDAGNAALCMGGACAPATTDAGNAGSCMSGASAAATSGKLCSLPTRDAGIAASCMGGAYAVSGDAGRGDSCGESRGAGTVFFSHCNMKCVFCQNYDISSEGKGIEISGERLAEIFLEQQARGAASLDLVTPTHYVPQIIGALDAAKKRGFSLPVVYNCGGYELPETIEALRGYVDIFLPDLKYFDDALSVRYSNAPLYFRYASASIEKMFEITGPFRMDGPRMTRGVIVRHLVLPGHYRDSFKILDYLKNTFGDGIYVSLMNQFTPMPQAAGCPEINRRLTTYEYDKVLDYAEKIGLVNCFIQRGRTATEKFIPKFDGTNVEKFES